MSVAFAANYLTFTAEEAGSKFGIYNSEDNDPDVQYSLDDGATWTVLKPGERVELKNVGDKALLKGNNPDGFSTAFEHDREYFYDYTQFIMTGKIAASGSVMSLVDGEGTSVKIPSNGCFYRLFKTCTALTKAPELPATTLRNQCYQEMFYDCTSLKQAPKLPATKLFPGCYMFMFYFCENLTESPDLPATEFFEEYSGDASRFLPCYGGMFAKCRSLTKIKVNIPDWGESYEVRKGEFDWNTSGWVTDVSFKGGIFVCPESLPIEYGDNRIPRAWTVKSREEEFANYLTFSAVDGSAEFTIRNFGDNAPNIQYLMNGEWIDLEEGETVKMKGKNSTIMLRGTNPEGFSKSETQYTKFEMTGNIEASGSVMSLIDGFGETTVIPNGYCFTHLFENCESLIQAPELPSKRLTNNCYEYMFSGCTSLAGAPELPATTLAAECYEGMFINCKKIRVSPELPATTMADYCYYSMFAGCKGIIKAPELPATTLADHCYYKMFSGCTFTKAPELPAKTLVDGCYSGMFSGCENVSQIKVNFTEWSEKSTSGWVYNVAPTGTFICPKALAIETGIDRIPEGWVVKYIEDITPNYLTFTAEEDACKFYMRNYYSSDSHSDVQYSLDGGKTWLDLDGTALLKKKGDKALIRGYNPEGFNSKPLENYFGMSGKIAASGSVMSLIDDIGEATVIPNDLCFACLFFECASLTKAPELPATTLTYGCYNAMFSHCTNLTKAPKLPATTLAEDCYSYMFESCKSLTEAPELPATTLADGCYGWMFLGCENLSLIRVNFTEWNNNSSTGWVYKVAPTGTFICPKALAIETGVDRIPVGWVVEYVEDVDVCVDPSTYTTAYSGGVTYTDNGVVEVLDNGYTAEIGTFTIGGGTGGNMTVFGGKADCAFKASWGDEIRTDDFIAGVGYHDSIASKKYTDLGDIYAVYNYTKSGTAGPYSYIGIHGYMKNPFIEFYIVDDSFISPLGTVYGCDKKGEYTVDGVTYRLMVGMRYGALTIEGEKNIQQIFAVRSSNQTCGVINVTEHFKNWEKFGLELGNIYDCKLSCEVGGGTGSIEYTCASMSWDGKRSSLGNLNCSKVSNYDLTDVVDAVASEIAVWTDGNTIYVRGAESDIEVYDMLGRLIVSKRGGLENIQISVPQKGVYVVKAGTETHKVELR